MSMAEQQSGAEDKATPNQEKMDAEWLKGAYEVRTTTNFLPKFDNQNEDKRLATLLDSQDAVLYVSKKHSGSLVMAPPFYSKNATANEFSRVGAVVLYRYFEAVWPGEGQAKFSAWWEDAERKGICYSFECVTPRVLGDHGATPKSAYMVLTAASLTREGRFLSPSELLTVATLWRLPLNEVWVIPGARADEVERELHALRWTMTDSDAREILDKYLEPGHQAQGFLLHGETQGEELEGFVLMALDADLSAMAALVREYNATMAPHHDCALAVALELGETCLDSTTSAAFMQRIASRAEAPLGNSQVYQEPERLKADISDEAVWALVCERAAAGPTRRLFERLRDVYSHSVRLQPYLYRGRMQVQVHVRSDEVFYGWALHTLDKSTAALYRGMVVTLFPQSEGSGLAEQADFGAAVPVRILGIAKLKCLNYMWRTFGVRNRLGILLRRGKADYLRTLKRGFYPPWSIPREHIPALDAFFARWADFALALPPRDKDRLQKAYLSYLDRFVQETPFPLTRLTRSAGAPIAKAEGVPPAPPARLSVLVANLSGTALDQKLLAALGLDLEKSQLQPEACSGLHGSFEVLDSTPDIERVRRSDVLLVIGPDDERMAACGLSENQKKAAHGAYSSFKKTRLQKLNAACKSTFTRCRPESAAAWTAEYKSRLAAAADSTEAAGTEADAPSDRRPVRIVVFTMALPPGGGKSSLFHGLQDALGHASASAIPGVSYCFRSSDDFKGRQPFEKEFVRCVEGRAAQKGSRPSSKGEPGPANEGIVVGYDKNIPNVDGLQRLLTLLQPLAKRFCLRLVAVVPDQLDHDVFWGRVKLRDPNKHIGLAIGPKLSEKEAYKIFRTFFFDACEEFQSAAACAPGAIVTDAFLRPVPPGSSNPLGQLVSDFREQALERIVGAPLDEVVEWADSQAGDRLGAGIGTNESAPGESQRVSPSTGNWCCAQVEGHATLHVTLVPPPASRSEAKDSVRRTALKELQALGATPLKIFASTYHVATLRLDPPSGVKRARRSSVSSALDKDVKRIAFWEVDRVEGLPGGLDLGQQAQILHITDRASMTRGVKAKNAAQVMAQLKGISGDPDAIWEVQSERHPVELSARVAFYK